MLFTEDADFLAEAAHRQATGLAFAGVIYIHQLHLDIGRCIADLEVIAKASDPPEWVDHVAYLPL